MAKLKITAKPSVTTGVNYVQPTGDRFISPTLINGYHIGGVGGDTGSTGLQIQGQSYVKGASSQACWLVAQKGAHKFLVQDALTNRGVCTLVNTPSPAAGQMNILVTLNTGTASVTAANVAGGASSTYVTWGSAPTGVIATPRIGDYIIGFAGTAAVARVTAINTASNVTIAVTGNVAAQSSVTGVTTNTYASKITNKFVYDFTSDGHVDSTSGTENFYNNGGYNPNKFRYVLSSSAGPNATFVKVQSA